MINKEKNDKIVAIHQPNFFPWVGYFHKIYASDVFVLFDTAQYSKKAFINRTFVRKVPNSPEKAYLTVPLKKHSDYTPIKDLRVDNSQDFRRKHLNRIKDVYHRSPFFSEYYPLIKNMIIETNNTESLAEINVFIIKGLMDILSLETDLVFSSSLPVNGNNSEYNINVVKHLKGEVYLSGSGAKDYQNDAEFEKEGIKLVYQDIYNFLKTHPYEQVQGDFINGLSILDALFNVGAEGIRLIFQNHDKAMSEKRKGVRE